MLLEKYKNKKILLAVSGGIDSIYMYHMFLNDRKKYSYDIGVAHINYNTSLVSAKSLSLCLNLSKNNNHPFYTKSVFLDTTNNFEHNARVLRYSFFKSIAKHESYDCILTAHTKDDLIETLFMRASTSDDYTSIPFNRSQDLYKRPILNINRKSILTQVTQKSYKYFEDPTNLDTKYTRNNIRHEILPNLTEKESTINRLLELYNIDRTHYNKFLFNYKHTVKNNILFKNRTIQISKDIFSSISIYDMKLILQISVKENFGIFISKTRKFWSEIIELIKSDKKNIFKYLSDDFIISFHDKTIKIHKIIGNDICKRIVDKTKWMDYVFTVDLCKDSSSPKMNNNTFICPESFYKDGLYVRKWINGDKYSISNNKNKFISKLFNENKIDLFTRKQYPIVIHKDSVKWIPGVAHSKNNLSKLDKLISISFKR